MKKNKNYSNIVIKNIQKVKVGSHLLDETQQQLGTADSYNPTVNFIKDLLVSIEKNYTQINGLTLTFQNKWLESDDKDLHRYINNKINNSTVWKKVNYLMFPEFDKNLRLHYHCIIYGSYDLHLARVTRWWRRTYGFAKPEKNLYNYKNWATYISKDYRKTGLWTIHSNTNNYLWYIRRKYGLNKKQPFEKITFT